MYTVDTIYHSKSLNEKDALKNNVGHKFRMSFLIYSIHHKNLQVIVRAMYKISNKTSPSIHNEIFPPKATHNNLRNLVSFEILKSHSVCNGTGILSTLGLKIWSLVQLSYLI